ncbi:Oidioi.mRNA.OKI2018_I69.chr2.g4178.t1.cds [Oikopleura dioica]|uniref:Oidioi.mRNA.OKI2018_I69.chr2.g4178.t1.cds n=1 Tax=Oikopleura dioica TaxID=34765 RepID=A0ABN7T2X8_OIKDI|nr:Oidioi.mRNA.OKI2018_I69.chr2.g4178.t1.cds [Oikopleura dioica]
MDDFIKKMIPSMPNASKQDLQDLYNHERLKRKIHRKGPAPKLLGDEECEICGQTANGYHYNVLSCEGCKGFFRRTIINGIKYTCRTGVNNCDLQTAMARQRCQKCRIMRCLKAGMNPAFVRKRKNDAVSSPYENVTASRPSVIVNKLPKDDEDLIQATMMPWRISLCTPVDFLDASSSSQNLFYRAISSLQLHIKKIFIAELPLVDRFSEDLLDIISESAINELIFLHIANSYDPVSKAIRFTDELIFTADDLLNKFTVNLGIVRRLFHFMEKFQQIIDTNFDISIIGLIAGSIFFKPDRGSSLVDEENLAELSKIHEKYISTLRSYIERYRSFNKTLLTEVLLMFTTLRELSIEYKHQQVSQGLLGALIKSMSNQCEISPEQLQQLALNHRFYHEQAHHMQLFEN